LKKSQEVTKQREFVKTKLYPYLLENTTSIEDAKMFIQTAGLVTKQQFMNGMMKTLVKDLKLKEMQADTELVKRYNGLFDLVEDMTVTDALKIIEGMPGEIDRMVSEENAKRKLAELKTNFL
jgi:hypothetical protein